MIRLGIAKIMLQSGNTVPNLFIGGHRLDVNVEYLASTVSSSLFLDAKLERRIGKAVTTIVRISVMIWEIDMLTNNTNGRIY